MCFSNQSFDLVVNFLGLEDIHMTRGRAGVTRTFREVSRILRADGFFCFVAMPPERMDTEAQRTEVSLFSFACGATWLRADEYRSLLLNAGLQPLRDKDFRTGRKLTPTQAKREIEYAIENVPRTYGVAILPFATVWQELGDRIAQHGMGHYSKVVLFVAQKRSIC
jgi:hypothetical protein